METLGPLKRVYRGYIGIIGYILGLYWANGKENGMYCSILGFYWDDGKCSGNCYVGFRVRV